MMADAPTEVTVEGIVAGLQLTGIGPNSGELTLTLNTPSGPKPTDQVFAGIMDSNHGESGIEHGVFAAYITVASTAFAGNLPLRCT
jgi:hypothetical protein